MVKIVSQYGKVGYVPKESSVEILEQIKNGYHYSATLRGIGEVEDEQNGTATIGMIKVVGKKLKPFMVRVVIMLVKAILIILFLFILFYLSVML